MQNFFAFFLLCVSFSPADTHNKVDTIGSVSSLVEGVAEPSNSIHITISDMQERTDALGSASPMTSYARRTTHRANRCIAQQSGQQGEMGSVMGVALPSAT